MTITYSHVQFATPVPDPAQPWSIHARRTDFGPAYRLTRVDDTIRIESLVTGRITEAPWAQAAGGSVAEAPAPAEAEVTVVSTPTARRKGTK